MAGAGPSGVAAGAAGFTTIYPVTECMEVGEGELVFGISWQSKVSAIFLKYKLLFRTNGNTASSVVNEKITLGLGSYLRILSNEKAIIK